MSRRPSRRSSRRVRDPETETAPRTTAEEIDPSRGRRRGRREGELTVDELAAETGMTVRNVRAYGSRGLLPPPRLEGRTGYYGSDHVARLTLVREMLDQGYTLTAAEKLITAAPGSGTQALGLYHALMSPWEEIEPEVVEPRSLAREAGIVFDRALIDRILELDLATEDEDGRIALSNPTLVRAGMRVVSLGVPAPEVLDIVPALRSHADAVAELFVKLIWDSLWSDFVEAGMPARQWGLIQQSFEEVIPLAGQALLAAFQESLGAAVEQAMREGLDPAALGLAGVGATTDGGGDDAADEAADSPQDSPQDAPQDTAVVPRAEPELVPDEDEHLEHNA